MSRSLKKLVSILLAAALLIPIGRLAPVAEAATTETTVYHEDFADGKGIAVQSGSASLTAVTGKVFDGNADGSALSVTNRANDYDAADFSYVDLGLENGKTYTVTVKGYVDAATTIPEGAQAYLQTIDSYGVVASANYAAGAAFTLTNSFTVDASKDTKLRVQSNASGKTVPFYIGDILITAPQTTTTKTIYHEDFADGKGIAVQSGSASLTAVTGKEFDGNEDGKALSVSNRANDYDAADFSYVDLGLENGKTYTVTVKGYVDAETTIPDDAQAYLQTIDSYGVVASANYAAGAAFTLTNSFTVDTSKDTKLRVQSNASGKSVPFYIGDILITETVSSGGGEEEPPRDPALPFSTITFEDQTTGGFTGRAGTETLTVTNEANHTADGSYALKVEGRTTSWHGPSLRVEKYVDKGYEYKVTAWVKLLSPATSTTLELASQIGNGSSANYPGLANKSISASDGWVQLQGTYRYNSVGDEYLTIYVQSSNATASYYIDDISFESTGSGPIGIQKDLAPIKEVYQDDFLIGNAITAEDLEGTRLELLNMHHNVVTAGNAMKPDAMQPTKGNFTFTAADAMVDKVLAEGMQMHGHVLVWHQQSPAWLNTTTDSSNNTVPLGREEALVNLRTHIQTVMKHFGDKVISWDVVNEAMNDNPPNPSNYKASLRQTPWYNAIGSDYVEQSFLAAREVLDAHPEWDIKLYYNDYNEDNQNKATAIYNMVKDINDRYAAEHDGKLLIDGVGMQGHYNTNTNPDNVKLSMEKFISLGVEVSISELDVMAGSNYSLPESLATAQAYLYAQLFNIFKEHADHIERVTFWGLDDNTSWRAANNPLLFDKNLQAKPAYYGVIDPDTFIEENAPETPDASQTTAKFGTPTIDGTIDPVWSQTAEIPINRYQMAWQGASGVAKALWDDHNLYVLIQVTDAQLDKASANAYEQDSVEIFLDQNNAKTSFYQSDDGQYRINYENETSFNPPSLADGFESATKVSGTNYTVEVKIPLTAITPENQKKLGFDVQINDAKDGARQSVAAWNDTTGNAYQYTSVFGVLTLGGKDTGGSANGGGFVPQTSTVVKNPDGSTTVKPEVKTTNGNAVGIVIGDDLKKALEQAAPAAGGKKQVIIDVPLQGNAASYAVQLPTQSLKSQDDYALTAKIANAFIQMPSNMLSNTNIAADQVSIRVAKASLDQVDAATRAQIGNRPVIDLSLVAGGNAIAWNNPAAPVTVAIPYTPTAEELQHPERIVIWYIDGSGKAIPVPNSRYDAATGAVIFQTTHFSTYAAVSVYKTFGDLAKVPWAKEAIEALAAREVIKGTGENTFSPNASIKRADFIALLVRAFELRGTGTDAAMFSDVPADAYYYKELAIAKQLGIATGVENNTFKPSSSISRQDMMALTARALAALGKQLPAGGSLDAFSDAASVAGYAKDSVAALVKAGVVTGSGSKLAPNDELTRAEAAVILYRIWKL
ncbi:endo-1,4-beta-xylanase [Paenibacillus glycanilyticus]|uniref:endo-1,4-beta-xylanase n=1 Tax=Paenibacillus glycanilyticus TaxID=126569 RepID=UPI00204199A6|nr:endo-1,4-beta-xylanase [Paenibacillus glycanilyticus]MCM3631246.1 endo-1,4-beta-xylanase [Paenibacillus glycanilyticus]